jgi:catechol 2,3-dioxygenase-like lactoylglutathione lyase family enzyme
VSNKEGNFMIKLAERGIHHIGFVVDDFEGTIEHLKSFYGVKEFQIYDFKPNKAHTRGVKLPECELKIAMCSLGKGNKDTIEIINPVVGESIFKEFLDKGSIGFNHICFPVDDFDDSRNYFLSRGAEIIFEVETEDDIIGFRRGMFVHDPELDLIIEIKENPYFRNK